MLQFESDDFLELNDTDLLAIQRSRSPSSITVETGRSFEIRAVLCQQKVDQQPVCQLVFYCSALKRALVFRLDGVTDPATQIRLGTEYLTGLGFQLDPLNLDLKPAVRETVLRDMSFLQKPEAVRRMRKERQSRVDSLEKTLKMLGKPAPSTKEGLEHRRTTEQLNAERKVEEHLETLREHFEQQFSALVVKVRVDDAAQPKQQEDSRPQSRRAEQQPAEKVPSSQKLAPPEQADRPQQPLAREPAAEPSHQAAGAKPQAVPKVDEQSLKSLEPLPDPPGQLSDVELHIQESQQSEVAGPEADSQRQRQITDRKLSRPVESIEQGKSSIQDEALLDKLRQDLAASVAAHKVELAARKQLEAELAAGETDRTERERQLHQAVKQSRDDLAEARKALAAVRNELEEKQQEQEKSAQQLADTRKELAGLQQQVAALDTERVKLKVESETLAKQVKAADKDRKEEEKSRLVAEGQLKELQTKLSESEQGNRQLGKQLAQSRQDLDLVRDAKDALARDASRSTDQLKQLEAELEQLRFESKSADAARSEVEQLQSDLDKLRGRYESLTRENAILVDECAAVRMKLANPERQAQAKPQAQDGAAAEPTSYAARQAAELQKQLDADRQRLKDLAWQQEQLAADYAEEQRKSRALQEELDQLRRERVTAAPVEVVKRKSEEKPPHVKRPPPLPGAFFHVDWDLSGLPCDVGAVSQVWRSIYNVTLSVEGYPHQYVGALIVMLKKGSENRLFVILHLEGEARNLVYRPIKPIASDQAAKNGLDEALKFLRVSGIEVESVPAGQVKNNLQPYLLQG
jgi:hypothetical protein